MKSIFYIFIALAILSACSSGNKETEKKDDTRVLMENVTDEQGVQRMQVSKAEQTVNFKGQDYHVSLVRTPDNELPMVKSEVGDMFVDNKITLQITHAGKQLFNRTFTKHDFASIAGNDFLKKSILEGMVFDKTTSEGLLFAVSISYPQTDLFFPISVTITPSGKMSMKREEIMEEFFYEEE